ncbi:MAG: mannose-6-phosphate isomerase, class I [Actinobacteria bacterium]|nr:mannose-6-phosphate isomerase, class I [Actinomycetota bacterium]
MPEHEPGLLRVENPVRDYAWGSPTAIPEALGATPTGVPQAELWLGAHPGDPSVLTDGTRLDDHLAGQGQRPLPFLMKLLAAASPLSLQVHPATAQAQAGFARDEAAGLDLADPLRSYKDPFHKPEIIVALSPFAALCGFRTPAAARDDLVALLPEQLATGIGGDLAAALSLPDEADALRAAFELVLSGRPEVRALAAAAVAATADDHSTLARTIRWVGEHYGDDPGVLGAALLNRVDLAPREALYLGAGNIHAYLSGFGIEAMAPSDNVLRGGLTPKRVDVAGLLEIVRFEALVPTRVEPVTSEQGGVRLTSYWPPAEEFSVHIVDADAGPRTLAELTGPAMLIVASGRLELGSGADTLVVERGQSLFQAAGAPLTVRALEPGSTAYLTTTGALT